MGMRSLDLKSVSRSVTQLSRLVQGGFRVGGESRETLRLFALAFGGITLMALLMGVVVGFLIRP